MPLIGVNSVTLRPERPRAFEEVVGQLAKKAIEKKERWRWTAHQTRIGDMARLHFVYQAADFGALEALGTVDELYRRVLGEKQGDELFVRSSECIQARQNTLSIERPDLSYAPDATARTAPAFDVVTLVRARPGQHEACEELIRKIAEAIPKAGDPTRLVTYQVVVGDLREYWTTRPLRRLADFDQQLATAELLNRAFGAAEGGLIWRSGNEAIAEVRRELVAYREDLSNPPQS